MFNKRVLIVDFNHQAYLQFFSKNNLSVRVKNAFGEWEDKDTRVQNGCMKNIFAWSKFGRCPTAVCFDRPCPSRREYFASRFPDMSVGSAGEYKGGRSKMPKALYTAVSDCEKLLRSAGVSVFAQEGYEADDLIYACVKAAKKQYPGVPIDIVTNDADLLPLVDDTVSVFLRSKKGTSAEDESIEKNKYKQVTPRNYQEVVQDLSAYSGFLIPYNSILLYKLLRGDPSDNYRRKDISKLFPPKKYNDLVIRMMNDRVNFEEIFRYGEPRARYRSTGEIFEGTFEEALKSDKRSDLTMYMSEECECILQMLREFTDMSEEMLNHVGAVYTGMNLNQPYMRRKRFVVDRIDTFEESRLRTTLEPLRIKLPENV